MKNIPNFKKIIFIDKLDYNINRKIEVGLRINGSQKKSYKNNPLITIITVVKITSKELVLKLKLDDEKTLGINKKITKGFATPPVK